MNGRPHFLYVMYWGALEPVGQATAIPTVVRMAESARMTVISFEKEEDWEDQELAERTKQRLEEAGVRWIPLDYSPGYRAVPRDVFRGALATRRLHKEEPIDAIEGRTFVGGVIGALASRWLSVPLLYHTEGSWIDEQVDMGRVAPDSWLCRILRYVERWIVAQAGGFVVLTRAGEERFRALYLDRRPDARVLIVPTTSVLVTRAPKLTSARVIPAGEPVQVVYPGSVSRVYLLGEMLDFFRDLLERRPGSTFRLLAHRDRDLVRAAVAERGLDASVELGSVAHDRLPQELVGKDVGLYFLEEGISADCRSPTKIPEYLAYGVTGVSTRASGDGAEVLEAARAGVILGDPRSSTERRRCLDELDDLLLDPERARRGQAVAEEYYSLDRAVELQRAELARLAQGS